MNENSIPDLYPRPQLVRNTPWQTLDGKWDYAINKIAVGKNGDKHSDGKINVPFSPECEHSGVMHMLTSDEEIYYSRPFMLDDLCRTMRTIIHFTAVDYECTVYVNSIEVCNHSGGYLPFSADISDLVHEGVNLLALTVRDPSDLGTQSRGKQKLRHSGIWYTPQSGIWGSVWLEHTPLKYIKDITLLPDVDTGTLAVSIDTGSDADVFTVTALDSARELAHARGTGTLTLSLSDFVCWSPEHPVLYDLIITAGDDVVYSYFGMRKFSLGRDSNGYMRLMLNNVPYFHNGVLDQGYYAGSLLTPPCEDAYIHDLEMLRDMGYNTVRKHIKIEPLRWYYHCDRLGLLVWQDMVNGGGRYSASTTLILPFLGVKLNDKRYKRFAREDKSGRDEYLHEAESTISLLKNTVSLAVWTPFNEGWGQFESEAVTARIRALDPTRLIDSASGWHDMGAGDFVSMHTYFTRIRVPRNIRKGSRAAALTEFGGYSLPVSASSSGSKPFGYRIYKTREHLEKAIKRLYEKEIIPNISKGLSAAIYTQLSDVEDEVNGFISFDRQIEKCSRAFMRELNAHVVLPEHKKENKSYD